MSAAEKAQARAVRLQIVGAIAELPKPDREAIAAVAEKLRAAIAEGEAQEGGVGHMAFALVGAELQEAVA